MPFLFQQMHKSKAHYFMYLLSMVSSRGSHIFLLPMSYFLYFHITCEVKICEVPSTKLLCVLNYNLLGGLKAKEEVWTICNTKCCLH